MVLLLPDHRGCLSESRPIPARKKCRTEACLPLRGLTTQTAPSAHLRFCVGACSRWEAKALHEPPKCSDKFLLHLQHKLVQHGSWLQCAISVQICLDFQSPLDLSHGLLLRSTVK